MRVDDAVVKRHLKNRRRAIFIQHLGNGQIAKVLCLVVRNLLPFHRESLCEISVAVKETYGCHVHVAVARFLQVVSGKNAKTTGVNLKYV